MPHGPRFKFAHGTLAGDEHSPRPCLILSAVEQVSGSPRLTSPPCHANNETAFLNKYADWRRTLAPGAGGLRLWRLWLGAAPSQLAEARALAYGRAST